MTTIGIVGSEAAKFDDRTRELAKIYIAELVSPSDIVCSGACHLGGIDIWAVEEAHRQHKYVIEHRPVTKSWTAGYKPRNELIARDSDYVVCITVRTLPEHYTGMRFPLCYHCGTSGHVKSGGCWTVKYAKKLGKKTHIYVID